MFDWLKSILGTEKLAAQQRMLEDDYRASLINIVKAHREANNALGSTPDLRDLINAPYINVGTHLRPINLALLDRIEALEAKLTQQDNPR